MPQESKVLVREVSAGGKAIEKLVPFDRTTHLYDPGTKQLREIVKPPAVQIAELRKEVADLKDRLAKLEERFQRASVPVTYSR